MVLFLLCFCDVFDKRRCFFINGVVFVVFCDVFDEMLVFFV